MSWPLVSLASIVLDAQVGFARQPISQGEGFPQLRTNNISQDGAIDLSSIKYVAPTLQEVARYSLRPGDILFNNTNSPSLVGKTAYFSEEETYLFSNHMTRIRVKADLADARYIARYLHWSWKRGRFQAFVTQWVNQAAINTNTLLTLKLPLPSLAEQQQIVEILDQADALRQARTRADQYIARILPVVFQGISGDPLTNPKGWPITRLGDLLLSSPNYGTMIPPSSTGAWLDLRVANIQDGALDLSDRKYVDLPKSDIARYEVRDGDLLLARAIGSIDHLGKCIVAYPGDEKWAFDSHLMRIRLRADRIHPEYLRAALESPGGRQLFLRHTRRSAVQFNINSGEFQAIEIPLPPLGVQNLLVDHTDQLKQIEDQAAIQRRVIENLFQSLMTEAFAGTLASGWRPAHDRILTQDLTAQTVALDGIHDSLQLCLPYSPEQN